jgi:hypothetical protein
LNKKYTEIQEQNIIKPMGNLDISPPVKAEIIPYTTGEGP